MVKVWEIWKSGKYKERYIITEECLFQSFAIAPIFDMGI